MRRLRGGARSGSIERSWGATNAGALSGVGRAPSWDVCVGGNTEPTTAQFGTDPRAAEELRGKHEAVLHAVLITPYARPHTPLLR